MTHVPLKTYAKGSRHGNRQNSSSPNQQAGKGNSTRLPDI